MRYSATNPFAQEATEDTIQPGTYINWNDEFGSMKNTAPASTTYEPASTSYAPAQPAPSEEIVAVRSVRVRLRYGRRRRSHLCCRWVTILCKFIQVSNIPGDVINVLRYNDADWLTGVCERTGQKGIIPINFVDFETTNDDENDNEIRWRADDSVTSESLDALFGPVVQVHNEPAKAEPKVTLARSATDVNRRSAPPRPVVQPNRHSTLSQPTVSQPAKITRSATITQPSTVASAAIEID